MNPFHSPLDPLAEDQAALWAAKLDGSSLSATERTTLDAWLAADPRHRTLLSQYCQFSADLEDQLPALVAAGIIPSPFEGRSKPRRIARVLWLAGTLAAAAAITVAVWVVRPAQQIETIATSVAQRKTLKLADGSRVELNARTSLLVNFGPTERHVRMADGEAFFTVVKNQARPFVVETPAGSVRVTGTVFDVHAETSAELGVTVVEGSVRVTPCETPNGRSSASVALAAHDQLIASGHAVAVRTLNDSELEDTLAWRRGEIVFDGTPLENALARFARYHGRTIIAARDVAKLRVGGRFSLDNLDGFLTAIEAVLPVQVSRESSGAIAVASRTGG